MKLNLRLLTPPYRLLLLIEWLLLAVSILSTVYWGTTAVEDIELSNAFFYPQLPVIPFFATLALGIIGQWRPNQRLWWQIIYLATNFCLLGLALTGNNVRYAGLTPLLLVIVIRSSLMFKRTGQIVVASLSFVIFVVPEFFARMTDIYIENSMPVNQASLTVSHIDYIERLIPPGEVFQHTFSHLPVAASVIQMTLQGASLFGIALIFSVSLVNLLLADWQKRKQLALANEQLRQYALQAKDRAAMQERYRIARDMHDSLGHVLTAQSLQLENAIQSWQAHPDKAQAYLLEGKKLGREAMQELRGSVRMLRSEPLHQTSLDVAIAQALQRFSNLTGILPVKQVTVPAYVSGKLSTAIYRILEEALTNIWKHSDASSVNISLHEDSLPGDRQVLRLTISDNGRGFQPNEILSGFGLKGIRERAASLGGTVQIRSHPWEGCCIGVEFPVSRTIV